MASEDVLGNGTFQTVEDAAAFLAPQQWREAGRPSNPTKQQAEREAAFLYGKKDSDWQRFVSKFVSAFQSAGNE
jgi:hypothetical protein